MHNCELKNDTNVSSVLGACVTDVRKERGGNLGAREKEPRAPNPRSSPSLSNACHAGPTQATDIRDSFQCACVI